MFRSIKIFYDKSNLLKILNDHVYHITDKTKGLLNFHCMNRNDRPCKINLEIYDYQHNILYRDTKQQNGMVSIEFRSRGDIFFRFINETVNLFEKKVHFF